MIAQAGDGSAWMWALTVCVLRLVLAQAKLAVRLVKQLLPGKQLFLAKGGQGSLPCFGKQMHG